MLVEPLKVIQRELIYFIPISFSPRPVGLMLVTLQT